VSYHCLEGGRQRRSMALRGSEYSPASVRRARVGHRHGEVKCILHIFSKRPPYSGSQPFISLCSKKANSKRIPQTDTPNSSLLFLNLFIQFLLRQGTNLSDGGKTTWVLLVNLRKLLWWAHGNPQSRRRLLKPAVFHHVTDQFFWRFGLERRIGRRAVKLVVLVNLLA
jgi:hypothetical protein